MLPRGCEHRSGQCMALAGWFGVSWNPADFLHLSRSAQRTRSWAAPFSCPSCHLTLCWQPNSTEKRRESPELRKCVLPRLPNLPSQQPISTPLLRARFTGARCCRIHPSTWNFLPVRLGYCEHLSAYSQSLPLWVALRFRHSDHLPQVSMPLTGFSLPTWLRMIFLKS